MAGAVAAGVVVGRDSGSDPVRTGDEDEGSISPADRPAEPESPAQLPDAVVVLEQRYANGHVRYQYSDESEFHMRFLILDASGNPLDESSSIQMRDRTPGCSRYLAYRSVNHVDGTWYEADLVLSDMPPSRREADLLRLNVDQGSLVPDGSELVDGRELLRYLSAFDGQPEPDATVTWVEPDSLRPVRVDGQDGDGEYVGTYTYLPRTPENLALLETAVPEGYTNTGTLEDDDDFAGPDPLCTDEAVPGG